MQIVPFAHLSPSLVQWRATAMVKVVVPTNSIHQTTRPPILLQPSGNQIHTAILPYHITSTNEPQVTRHHIANSYQTIGNQTPYITQLNRLCRVWFHMHTYPLSIWEHMDHHQVYHILGQLTNLIRDKPIQWEFQVRTPYRPPKSLTQ